MGGGGGGPGFGAGNTGPIGEPNGVPWPASGVNWPVWPGIGAPIGIPNGELVCLPSKFTAGIAPGIALKKPTTFSNPSCNGVLF